MTPRESLCLLVTLTVPFFSLGQLSAQVLSEHQFRLRLTATSFDPATLVLTCTILNKSKTAATAWSILVRTQYEDGLQSEYHFTEDFLLTDPRSNPEAPQLHSSGPLLPNMKRRIRLHAERRSDFTPVHSMQATVVASLYEDGTTIGSRVRIDEILYARAVRAAEITRWLRKLKSVKPDTRSLSDLLTQSNNLRDNDINSRPDAMYQRVAIQALMQRALHEMSQDHRSDPTVIWKALLNELNTQLILLDRHISFNWRELK